jgi:hypothetical protein
MPLPKGTRQELHEILVPLRNGMGGVYRAADSKLRRERAIDNITGCPARSGHLALKTEKRR